MKKTPSTTLRILHQADPARRAVAEAHRKATAQPCRHDPDYVHRSKTTTFHPFLAVAMAWGREAREAREARP